MGTLHYGWPYIISNQAAKEVTHNEALDDIDAGLFTVASAISSGTMVNAQTASYTAVLADANEVVSIDNAAANTFTVPANATVAFPIGATLTVIQLGTGQTTLTPAGVVVINSPSTLQTRVQYSTVSLIQVATDVWNAAGDLL